MRVEFFCGIEDENSGGGTGARNVVVIGRSGGGPSQSKEGNLVWWGNDEGKVGGRKRVLSIENISLRKNSCWAGEQKMFSRFFLFSFRYGFSTSEDNQLITS